jgi:hypothetical protein
VGDFAVLQKIEYRRKRFRLRFGVGLVPHVLIASKLGVMFLLNGS